MINKKNSFWYGILIGTVINLVLVFQLFTSVENDLKDLEITRAMMVSFWVFNLACLGVMGLIYWWLGGRTLSLSLQDDDLPPKALFRWGYNRKAIIGFGLSALVILSLSTLYMVINFRGPQNYEKCAAVQELSGIAQAGLAIKTGDSVQAAADLEDEYYSFIKRNYFLNKYIDGIDQALQVFPSLLQEIKTIKEQGAIGVKSAVEIHEHCRKLVSVTQTLSDDYCLEASR